MPRDLAQLPQIPATSMPGQRALLTAQDVAQALNVSERSVRRWIATGELPVVRLGRTVRIRPQALDALIERGAARE
jgi:excisionase family DNA binding protein